ncbi:MAG: hypothetical protein IKL70_00205 [Oscillospiraceae bacterium]|nr:hypothetical protein [Oscillospiraceae bacterium]
MMKVEIELDEQKIIDDGKYVPESILECLDDAFVRNGQQILEAQGFRRVYRDGGNTEKDFAVLGRIVMDFSKEDFFLPYANKILWYDSDDKEDENDFDVEDFLPKLLKYRTGVVARG